MDYHFCFLLQIHESKEEESLEDEEHLYEDEVSCMLFEILLFF